MKTVKLSHSILSAWSQGKQEEAVAMYLGRPYPVTDAMELGKAMDEKWNKHIADTGEFPDELVSMDSMDKKVGTPIIQQKYRKTIPFSDEYQIMLSGVPDLVTDDDTVIIDFKCGRTEANQYIDRFQLDYYKILLPKATRGEYRCWNPYLHKLTIGIKYLNDSNAESALNHILTYGGEIIDYLLTQRLLIDYKE